MSKEQQSGKMWAGRFRAAPDPFFDFWQRSIRFDYQLLGAELSASKAHALALQAAGILTQDECPDRGRARWYRETIRDEQR
jgi:argininosuccinate lyase